MSYHQRKAFRQATNALEQVDVRARATFLSSYFLENIAILTPAEREQFVQKILNGVPKAKL